ncbi:MAG: PKD domain-containing protein [Acidobacteriota bacterium]
MMNPRKVLTAGSVLLASISMALAADVPQPTAAKPFLQDWEVKWIQDNVKDITNTPEFWSRLALMQQKTIAAKQAGLGRSRYGDFGNIAAMENDGSLIIGNFVNIAEVTKRFIDTHPDQYDEINVLTEFDSNDPTVYAYYALIYNDVQGIGGLYDYRTSNYGLPPNAFVQGSVNMQTLAYWPSNNTYIAVMGQEAEHRFAARIELPDQSACANSAGYLLGRDCAHWSFYNETYGSVMEGNLWTEGPAGHFTTSAPFSTYSELDEYLMGLRLDTAVVQPMFVLTNPTNCSANCPPPGAPPTNGFSCDATKNIYTMGDIVTAYGARVPDANTSKKTFRQAWIMITDQGAYPPQAASLTRYDTIRTQWETYFNTETNGLGNMDTRLFLPGEPPYAGFDAAVPHAVPGAAIQFDDHALNGPITSYLWDFGDGTTSNVAAPAHAYAAPGTYDVSLTVTSANGSNTKTRTAYADIQARPPKADFDADDTFSPTAPLTVNFANKTDWNATSYLWDFGDGNTSNAANPSHTYAANGGYLVTLTATNANGSNTRGIPSYVNVGSTATLFTEAFETGAAGWTHSQITKADDWLLGAPNAPTNPFEPPAAHGGTNVYGNRLSANKGYYVVDEANYLQSPVINASSATSHVVLDYWRWLSVEDGIYDWAKVYAGKAAPPNAFPDDKEVWRNPIGNKFNHTRDRAWYPHTVSLTAAGAGNANLQIQWLLKTDAAGCFGGWNIDDVAVYATNSSPPNPTGRVVVGPGPGTTNPNQVSVFDRNGMPLTSWAAYGAGSMGTTVGNGDIDGDDFEEVLSGPGPGQTLGPQIRAFNAWDGSAISKVNFYAYGTLRYGVNEASGSVDGDRWDEIITGPGAGPVFGPHVRGWNFDGTAISAIQKISFFAYSTLKYGCVVANGDVEADNYYEIISGAGPGVVFGPHVRGWDYDNIGISQVKNMSAFVFTTTQFGVNVAAADVDEDATGQEEVIAGKGPGPSFDGLLRAFNYSPTQQFQLYTTSDLTPYTTLYGVRVGGGDLDGGPPPRLMTHHDYVVCSPGPDPTATARVKMLDGYFTFSPSAPPWTVMDFDILAYGTLFGAIPSVGFIQ